MKIHETTAQDIDRQLQNRHSLALERGKGTCYKIALPN